MKKFLFFAVALLFCGALSAQTSNELITEFNNGAAALQAKDFQKAVTMFENVVAKGEASEDETVKSCVQNSKKYISMCYRNIGVAALKTGDADKAIEYATKSIEKAQAYGDSQSAATSNRLMAVAYLKKGGDSFNNKDYKTAAEIFEKGYAADPHNTATALNLAMSYCELKEYEKGMKIYNDILALPENPKYTDAQAKAKEMKSLYTNNMIAQMQKAGDNDGIIAMADKLAANDPATAAKIRLQAYNNKKDYAKVIELAESAAAVQTSPEDKSDVYFILGAAYNAKEMKPQAIEAMKKVVAGGNVAAAKKSIEDLTTPPAK